jgi:RNA polymerase sigma-70 factor (ECF subfamily)
MTARFGKQAPPAPADKVPSSDGGELLVRHRDGDDEAFAELVGRYRRPVYGYLVRCGVEEGARDDLFQEVFTSIHGAAMTYRADHPLRPWLFAIAANVVRTHYRRTRSREERETSNREAATPGGDAAPDAHALAEARETAVWVEAALAALPLAEREIVVLCCIEQLPQADVAAVLEMPVNTVKTHLRRARLTLAAALARRNAALRREVS